MRNLLEHPIVLVIITCIAGVTMFSLYVSAQDGSTATTALTAINATVERQEQRVAQLEEQVRLANDPFIQEKIRRDERLQQLPGEVVLQLPPIIVPTPQTAPTTTPLTPWEEWQRLLFE